MIETEERKGRKARSGIFQGQGNGEWGNSEGTKGKEDYEPGRERGSLLGKRGGQIRLPGMLGSRRDTC